jgi:hypothetical protein
MITKQKDDLSLVALTNKRILVLVHQVNRYTAMIVKAGEVLSSVQAEGDTMAAGLDNVFAKISAGKVGLPKRVLVVSGEFRETALSLDLSMISDNKQRERSVQFAAADMVESLFASQEPEISCVLDDRVPHNEWDQLIEVLPALAPSSALKQTVKSLGIWDNATPTRAPLVKSAADVAFTFRQIEHDNILVSFLAHSVVSEWQDFAAKKNLQLVGIVSEESLARSAECEALAYLTSDSASLLHWKSGKIESYSEFSRIGSEPPSVWLAQLDSLPLDKVKVICSQADQHILKSRSGVLATNRFSTAYIKNSMSSLVLSLQLKPEARLYGVIKTSETPQKWFKRKSSWSILAATASISAAASVFIPSYLELHERVKKIEKLEAKEQVISANLTQQESFKVTLDSLNEEIRKLSSKPQSRNSTKVSFPFLQDHQSFLNTLSKSLEQTGTSIELTSFTSNWKGELELHGNAQSLIEARAFTDKFAELVEARKLPKHTADLSEDSQQEIYLFSIKPYENSQ